MPSIPVKLTNGSEISLPIDSIEHVTAMHTLDDPADQITHIVTADGACYVSHEEAEAIKEEIRIYEICGF